MRTSHTLLFAWIMGLDTAVAIMVLALTVPIFLDEFSPIMQKAYFTEVLLESRNGQIALIEQQVTAEPTPPETNPILHTATIGGRYTLSTQIVGNTYTINGRHPENNRSFSLSLTPSVISNEPTGSIQWLYGYNGTLLHEKSYPFSF